MFDQIGIFLRNFFLKMVFMLPPVDLSEVDDYVENTKHYLGIVNYYVPLGLMAEIFSWWSRGMFAAFGVFILIKYFKKMMGI